MRKLMRRFGAMVQRAVDLGFLAGLSQDELKAEGNDAVMPELAALSRRAGAEGCVLLKNDGVLPLNSENTVAVFGRCQFDWFYVGYGSGGDVHPPYRVNLVEGLLNAGIPIDIDISEQYRAWCSSKEHRADHGWWGHWPMCHPEMPLNREMVQSAAKRCETAIVVIGRAAGEDRENTLSKGSYYLTDDEISMLNTVTTFFRRTIVVLNIGSIMDLSWIKAYEEKISAALIAWQGGMESGNAVADVLIGKVNPCGRLADTVALRYEDYPSAQYFGGRKHNYYAEDIYVGYRYFHTFAEDKVLYPFGFGLSYTTFKSCPGILTIKHGRYALPVQVTNTGHTAGSEVVMLYCSAPQGKLGKPVRTLVSFGKTRLLGPGETEELCLYFDDSALASYDDSGKTGFCHAFVLESGEYRFYLENEAAGEIFIPTTKVISQCESACPVTSPFSRLIARKDDGKIHEAWETVFPDDVNLRQRILDNLPETIPVTGDRGYLLSDVSAGSVSLETFIAQLTDKELEALTRGEGAMGSSLGTSGNAGAFGGILPTLRQKGVPPVITADGPSGVRLKRFCALLPSGTALACTWDTHLIEKLYAEIGKEMIRHQLDILLAPGMNIHRNPLCGRNFEYFSEDPLLTGKMAAAVVRGIQSQGVSCCPKHFACNNQETRRNINDSRVSQRALREIYLRGFEIVIREAKPNAIMTSYNKINGVWSHYNYDLVTTLLRKEWNFDGLVMTDWWMKKSRCPEFPRIRDNAYRVRAQVDVLMPGNVGRIKKKYTSDGTLLRTIDKKDGISRGEIQRCARNVLCFILKNKV